MIIGIGCDIVKINRLVKNKEGLSKKILTKKEYEHYKQLPPRRQLEFLAGHFAAKEALVKAMDKECLVSDFEICYVNKKPTVYIEGYNVQLSIAHEEDYAYSCAIVER